MCPHGYHHSGSMATPALGTRDVYIYVLLFLCSISNIENAPLSVPICTGKEFEKKSTGISCFALFSRNGKKCNTQGCVPPSSFWICFN